MVGTLELRVPLHTPNLRRRQVLQTVRFLCFISVVEKLHHAHSLRAYLWPPRHSALCLV